MHLVAGANLSPSNDDGKDALTRHGALTHQALDLAVVMAFLADLRHDEKRLPDGDDREAT